MLSFDKAKLLNRGYGRLKGIGLPGGRTLWYSEWLPVRISAVLFVLRMLSGFLALLALLVGATDAALALMAAFVALAVINVACVAVDVLLSL